MILRRHARAALAALEVLLEQEGVSVGDMGARDIGTEVKMMEAIRAIRAKHARSITVDDGAGSRPRVRMLRSLVPSRLVQADER